MTCKNIPLLPFLAAMFLVSSGCLPDSPAPSDQTPPPPVTDLTATSGDTLAGTLIVSWTAVQDRDVEDGNVFAYELRYSQQPITESGWEDLPVYYQSWTPEEAGAVETHVLYGMTLGATCHVGIKTVDANGNASEISNLASAVPFEGFDSTAPARITDLSAAAGATAGTVDLTWTAPGDDLNMGSASHYVVRYSSQPITESNFHSATDYAQTWVPRNAGYLETRTLTVFTSGTTIYVALIAIDDVANASPVSNCASATFGAPARFTTMYTDPRGLTFNEVWGSGPNDVYAVGYSGAMIHYDGNAWTAVNIPANQNHLYAIWGSGASDIWVGGDNGTLLHFDGASWSSVNSGTATSITSIWGTSPSDVYAVGWDGANLHYDGQTWSSLGTVYYRNAIWGSGPNDVWVSGGICSIHIHFCKLERFDGTTWTEIADPPCCGLLDIWGASRGDVFAVGRSCAGDPNAPNIVHFDGSAWTGMRRTNSALNAIWGASGTNVFAVGENGSVEHYDGNAWTPVSSGTTAYLTGVWGSSGTDVFAVGSGGVIIHYP